MNNEENSMNNVPEEVVAIVKQENLNEAAGAALVQSFAPYHEQITHALETSRTIKDGETLASQKVARTCRLELRRIRCEIENTRKTAKTDALRYGKAVDGMANVLKFLCEPEEKRLEDIEKHAERIEAARLAQLVAERSARLIEVEADPLAYNLESMDDATFDGILETAERMRKERIEAERKAEAERIAKEKAEAEERERMRAENERLKAEAEAREKAAAKERAEAEAERKRVEAERAKERAELEAKAKAEAEAREKAEAETRAAKAREDAAERKRLADVAAAKAKADADAKAEQARLAAEKEKEEDNQHRRKIMNAAYKCLIESGIEETAAKAVVKLVVEGSVANMKMVW